MYLTLINLLLYKLLMPKSRLNHFHWGKRGGREIVCGIKLYDLKIKLVGSSQVALRYFECLQWEEKIINPNMIKYILWFKNSIAYILRDSGLVVGAGKGARTDCKWAQGNILGGWKCSESGLWWLFDCCITIYSLKIIELYTCNGWVLQCVNFTSLKWSESHAVCFGWHLIWLVSSSYISLFHLAFSQVSDWRLVF